MASKGNSHSDYDQCNTLILSAYFCLTGRTKFDNQLRKSLEDILVELLKTKNQMAPSNIISFCSKRREPS